MQNYSGLILLLFVGAARLFFIWKIVRGEDRRSLMDLERMAPKLYAFGINLVLAAALAFLLIYAEDRPYFLVAALGIVALFGLSQAWLERKYLPNTRRHLATLLSLAVTVVVMAGYFVIYPLYL